MNILKLVINTRNLITISTLIISLLVIKLYFHHEKDILNIQIRRMVYSGIPYMNDTENNLKVISIKEAELDTIPLSTKNLIRVLKYYNISHADIVLAQSLLETHYFKSSVCKYYHNLFGLTNPYNHRYYRYSNWTKSVKGYRDMIQYRYKGKDNYYKFLEDLGYAEDPYYVFKVYKIANRILNI